MRQRPHDELVEANEARRHLKRVLPRDILPELSPIQRYKFIEVVVANLHPWSVATECNRAETG